MENQKEHLILLLANMDMRGIDSAHQGERQIHMVTHFGEPLSVNLFLSLMLDQLILVNQLDFCSC